MQVIKQHIIFKIFASAIALLLLVPTVVKFNHIFADHEHDICLGEKSTHLHELNTDCDFHKFNINTPYCFFSNDIELFTEIYIHKTSSSLYTFLHNHRQLSFSLRGPPVLV